MQLKYVTGSLITRKWSYKNNIWLIWPVEMTAQFERVKQVRKYHVSLCWKEERAERERVEWGLEN